MNYLNILKNVLLGLGTNITNAVGYVDTGNTLRCSMTGRRVAIVGYEVAAALAPKSAVPIIDDYMKSPTSIYQSAAGLPHGFYLVPYNTICSEGQMLLAMDADYMFIDSVYLEKKPLLGISPANIGILQTKKCVLLNKYYMKRGKRHAKHY